MFACGCSKASSGLFQCECDKEAFEVQLLGPEKLCPHEKVKMMEAAHCMIYAKSDHIIGKFGAKDLVLMELRFDGTFGFPGGIVEKHEPDVITGLNREMVEEMHLDTEKHAVNEEHYVVSHFHSDKKLYTHFYAMEVSVEDFIAIEKRSLDAYDYGSEVMGVLRPPLYIMEDGYGGLPAFLDNNFIPNSKEQLLYALCHCNLITEKVLRDALIASKNNKKIVSCGSHFIGCNKVNAL